MAAHNERRQPAKLARSCGCLPRGGKHCSLPGFAPLNRGPTLTTPQCPAPTARRPGNGCPRKPHSVSISPSVGRGAPTPPRPSVTALPRATRRGRRPRRPAKPPANGHPPGSHPRRGQDPSLQTDPQTSAYANSRAGHARPLPRGGGQAPCRPQTPAEGSRPLPTDRPINECPPPAARRCGNGDKKPRRSLFPGLPRFFI